MVKLEIQDYSSADVDQVWAWTPTTLSEVFFQLSIQIGMWGEQGGHWFQLTVATPEGLAAFANSYPNSEFPDRNIMVVRNYVWENLLERLNRILSSCVRNSWEKSLLCLQRFFQWEYEDISQG